jgi:nucleotide-binding universal stress UspA family protein
MKTIVVGYSGTEQGERALARAAELAQPLEAKLVVVSVGRSPGLAAEPVLEPELAFVPSPIGPMPSPELRRPVAPPCEQPSEGTLLLERARSFLMARRVDAEYVTETGDPTERLLDVADDRNAELIVVGSSEHGLLGRILGHGVDEKVARRAQRDVLLVH